MIYVICGGQFGSEGKGLMASYFARYSNINIATTDCGPNAGHTAIWDDKKVITYHLPMSGVLSPNALIYLNGGAIIDVDKLHEEITELNNQGFKINRRLAIHPNAAIIRAEDKDLENRANSTMQHIASTQKGVGSAAASKVLRHGMIAKDIESLQSYVNVPDLNPYKDMIIVEVAQGYSLGINAGFYPFTTHRACTPAQGLMNANLPTNVPHEVWAVIRVNPIRVGNIPGGYSGGCYMDQIETNWEELGQEPQYTTVTKRVRRVFTYSYEQVREMIKTCNPNTILINFAQTVKHQQLEHIAQDIMNYYKDNQIMRPNFLYGFGPKPEDIQITMRHI